MGAYDLYCRNWLHEVWLLWDEHIVQLWTPPIESLEGWHRAVTVDDDGLVTVLLAARP